MEDKIITTTISSRVNVQHFATLSEYFYGQGFQSQGSIARAAMETLATILTETEKARPFEDGHQALEYLQSIFPMKGIGYSKPFKEANALLGTVTSPAMSMRKSILEGLRKGQEELEEMKGESLEESDPNL